MAGQLTPIKWFEKDSSQPSLRKSGVRNLFIKNLDRSIDSKDMYDTFSTFGTILSCKVATDEHGNSKGYGFVHFETEEAANKAIEKVNGMLLLDKKLVVSPFIVRSQREKAKRFTNVFIKNLPETFDEDKLREIFESFGTITSYRVMHDEHGKSRGFGFVSFENPEAAEAACNELNTKEIEGKTLHVGRAQKRGERQMELSRKFELLKIEQMARYQGVNLYVKNLDDTIDDEKLSKVFEPFGTITSAKVMTDDGRSKGFGFVCFSSPEEATKAIAEMNGRIVGTKPLNVALAQLKRDRQAHLTSQIWKRMGSMSNMRMPQIGQVYNPGSYLMPPIPPQQLGFYAPAQLPGILQSPGWVYPSQVRPGCQGPTTAFAPMQAPFRQYRGGAAPGVVPAGAAKSGIRPQIGRLPAAQAGTVATTGFNGPLSASALAAASPQDQRQILGNRLYPLIQKKYPKIAGKVTGMLLEMDTSDILHLLDDRELLASRVEEAVAVLSEYQKQQAAFTEN